MDEARRLELAYLLALGGDRRTLAERLAQVDLDLIAARPPAPAPDAVVGGRSLFDPRTGRRTTVELLADGRELTKEETPDAQSETVRPARRWDD
jgi:hypothetical protein